MLPVLDAAAATRRYASGPRPVATLGYFDGVHRGHQAVLAALRRRAIAADGEAVVVTFAGHPREVLTGAAPPLLTPLAERLRLFAAHGMDAALVLRFDVALAAVPAERFASECFGTWLRAAGVVVGARTRFGAGGRGTPDDLVAFGRAQGFDVEVVPALVVGGEPVSSTRIRDRVVRGDLDGAAELLGRPIALVGPVVRGARRGQLLGFPTANLGISGLALPPDGVYAARASFAAPDAPDGARLLAVVNIGLAPTFGGEGARRVEAHLIGWTGDCYDRELRLELVRRLRDERRFPDVEALRAQIAADVTAARAMLGG